MFNGIRFGTKTLWPLNQDLTTLLLNRPVYVQKQPNNRIHKYSGEHEAQYEVFLPSFPRQRIAQKKILGILRGRRRSLKTGCRNGPVFCKPKKGSGEFTYCLCPQVETVEEMTAPMIAWKDGTRLRE
ncbi:hypothetical protein AVEN_274438-1 [Araneus ventricosus]|uniref:Uncharacterized protein n=1 Tax=Araneus ventricosus TaxID=182803 RepID=A0A4Y2F4I2_ARAVE|nr:hypothetical protein AVEN_274438-1 [Araneus ventricosus]